MKIIAFIGPSGAGKTSAIRGLDDSYDVIREKYMELNRHKLDNKLMLSKWSYINYWYDSVLSLKKSNSTIAISDRSPLDTCAYVEKGEHNLMNAVLQTMDELGTMGIEVIHVLITANIDVLRERVANRIKSEPERVAYHETEEDHAVKAYEYYHTNMHLWAHMVDTSSLSADEVSSAIISLIETL